MRDSFCESWKGFCDKKFYSNIENVVKLMSEVILVTAAFKFHSAVTINKFRLIYTGRTATEEVTAVLKL